MTAAGVSSGFEQDSEASPSSTLVSVSSATPCGGATFSMCAAFSSTASSWSGICMLFLSSMMQKCPSFRVFHGLSCFERDGKVSSSNGFPRFVEKHWYLQYVRLNRRVVNTLFI